MLRKRAEVAKAHRRLITKLRGTKISAGKRLSSRTNKGKQWICEALIEAAHRTAYGSFTFTDPGMSDQEMD